MLRTRTSFRPSFEKLDDRLCLSGTPLAPLDFSAEPAPTAEFAGHMRVFDGVTSAEVTPYGGFTGGVRVAAGDVDGADWGSDWISGGTGQDAPTADTGAALHLKPLTPQAADDVMVDGLIITGEDPAAALGGAGLDILIGNTGGDRAPQSSSGANFVFCDGAVR